MKNYLIIIGLILLFIFTLPVTTKYHNLTFFNFNNKIDEYIDKDTGVVYLKSGTYLTPKLDQNGKVMVKNKQP